MLFRSELLVEEQLDIRSKWARLPLNHRKPHLLVDEFCHIELLIDILPQVCLEHEINGEGMNSIKVPAFGSNSVEVHTEHDVICRLQVSNLAWTFPSWDVEWGEDINGTGIILGMNNPPIVGANGISNESGRSEERRVGKECRL